jgi:3-hydroxybutyryl-CoA dehydrogenase
MRITQANSLPFEDVDVALRAQGFKMGPYQLMDMIGLDINFNVTRLVWEGLGCPERFTPNELQASRVTAGDLGLKTGKGFYEYPS